MTRPRVPALCNLCGAVRTVAPGRTVDQRTLKCATCQGQTRHSLLKAEDEPDWREAENRVASSPLAEVAALESFLTRMGIYVWEYAGAQGGAEVRRYLAPLARPDGRRVRWVVGIDPSLAMKERAAALRWAWRDLLPNPTWDKCPPLDDGDGRLYVALCRVPATRSAR